MRLRDFVNSRFSLKKTLESQGIHVGEGSCSLYCPFHEDSATGHKSAKFFEETDTIFCYSEHRSFSAFDAFIQIIGITEKQLQAQALGMGWEPSNAKPEFKQSFKPIERGSEWHNFRLNRITFTEYIAHLRTVWQANNTQEL